MSILTDCSEINHLIYNALTSRVNWFNRFFESHNNINDECNYPETGNITPELMKELYDRECIPTRANDILPMETWNVQPCIYEDENEEIETEFERALKDINSNLSIEVGYCTQDKLSALCEYFLRVDKLSGIGSFGVMLLGINDNNDGDLSRPVNISSTNELLFIRCFPETMVTIAQYETDTNNKRFGYPLYYNITLNSPDDTQSGGIGLTIATITVHYSRVIHIADNLLSSEVHGVPRLKPILNRLLDLRKIYAGSGEMYWKGAFPGLSIESNPQLGADLQINEQKMKDMMEQYMSGLQRYLALIGMNVKSLSPQVVDPTPLINTHIDAICIEKGIPKRIFMGSERGNLASEQDDDTWKGRLNNRRINYITPRIIAPFLDRLINIKVLPTPKTTYTVYWPDMSNLTTKDKASIGFQKTQSLSQYVSNGLDMLIAPLDYLVSVIGYDNEEAKQILENAKAYTLETSTITPDEIQVNE